MYICYSYYHYSYSMYMQNTTCFLLVLSKSGMVDKTLQISNSLLSSALTLQALSQGIDPSTLCGSCASILREYSRSCGDSSSTNLINERE